MFNTHTEELILSDNSLTIEQLNSQFITVTVLPEDATDKSVTWSSSNVRIATVVPEGGINQARITGVGLGTCIITCKSNESEDVIATCEIEVVPVYTGTPII